VTEETVFGTALTIAFVALILSIAMAIVRLVRGPTLPDRVVALDLIAFLAIGFIALYAIAAGKPAALDAALTLALIAFLGTVAFARYVEHFGERREEEDRSQRS
jgi:multicomponent Na+:H+ antiporter subunit F